MKTHEFDYLLPEHRIAQTPALPRESCKLLVAERNGTSFEHKHFADIQGYLQPGDLLVVNDTKVIPARLKGYKAGMQTPVELLLLHQRQDLDTETPSLAEHWQALVKPGRRLKPGSLVELGALTAEIIDWADAESKGERIIRLESVDATQTVSEALQSVGVLPLPPYIKHYTGDSSLYQTVYAREENSAAAPTAGLHFSTQLLEQIQAQGVQLASVCLEIGLDTFRKVEVDDIADHHIHSESYSISEHTVQAIDQTRKRGGRVWAVGTTAVRALESAACGDDGHIRAVAHEQTQLYITPGYQFKVVDALVTNFHTPRSTLLMLVSAFAGHATMKAAYEEALAHEYRFLSFGDAMLIV